MENNNRKKLLITASTFPRWKNDTEPRFILDFAKAMLQYYDVTVLVPAAAGAKEKEILEGVKVIRYHYLPVHKWETLCYPGAIVPRIKEKKTRIFQVPFLMFSLWRKLFELKDKYDFVHAHWLIPQGIIQSFVSSNYLVTGHGTDVTSLNKSVIKILKHRCLKRSKHITVVSGRLKQELIEIYDIPKGKISVIPMGCDTTIFSPVFRNKEYFKNNVKKNIIFVGRLAEIKGVKYLIDAMQYVDANLYIIGKGQLEKELKKQASKYKDRIIFMGPKTHDELVEIYASADIFAAPSITAKNGAVEGFGLVIIEAMASGIPVVASRSGGIVDIIEHGENGLLAEEKNSKELAYRINQLLNDEKLRKKISENSVQTAAQYDYKQIAAKYRALIDSLI